MAESEAKVMEVDTRRISAGRRDSTRVPELDALRGLGALSILAYHLWPSTFFFGWTRVDLFFVLSGFLITSVILKHGSSPHFLRTFWIRRILRIWPAYYLLLAIVCGMAIAAGAPIRPDASLFYLTFTQNVHYYWSGAVPPFPREAMPTWSLAIEEQFYLVWPLIVVVGGRSILIPATLFLMSSSIVARVIGLYPAVALARCDGLALGTLLAALVGGGQLVRPSRRLSVVLVGLGLVSLLFIVGPASQVEEPIPGVSGCGPLSIFAANLLYFSIIGLVVCHTGHPLLGPLRSRALAYIGRISYGVFLYHLIIIDVVTKYLGPRSFATDMAAVLLSLLAGAWSWELLERPIGNLKDRFRYQPEPTATSDGPRRRGPTVRTRSWAWKGVLGLLGLGALVLCLGLNFAPGLASPRRGFFDMVHTDPSGVEIKYVLFVPHNYRVDSPCPLIVFLHGSGAVGTDGRLPLVAGLGPAIRRQEATFPFLALFPQASRPNWRSDSPDGRTALAILAEVERDYNVDRRRVYLTGMSMGGNGTFSLAAAHPELFAAIVPVCGWGDPQWAERIERIPCWCFHGEDDEVVRVDESRAMVGALRARGQSPRFTTYPGVGHNCWDLAYTNHELYDWLLAQRRDDSGPS